MHHAIGDRLGRSKYAPLWRSSQSQRMPASCAMPAMTPMDIHRPLAAIHRSMRCVVASRQRHYRYGHQLDRCSIAATLPRRSPSIVSSARRLPRSAGSSALTITPSKNASTCGRRPGAPAPPRSPVLQAGAGVVDGGGDRFGQRALGVLLQQRRVDLRRNVALGLAQDVADAVGRSQCFGFRQCGEGADRIQAAVEVVQRGRLQFGYRVEVRRHALSP